MMMSSQTQSDNSNVERRKYPRYEVAPMTKLAIEDESLGESIGIGEAGDISIGGLRVRHLPPDSRIATGDILGMLLIGEDHAFSLRGEVVHHGTEDSFGIEFRELTAADGIRINDLIGRLDH